MSYKTIAVHLNDEKRASPLLAAAVGLARRFDAHLIGVHVSPALSYVPPLPGASGLLQEIRRTEKEICERIGAAFQSATADMRAMAEIRFIDPPARLTPSEVILPQVRTADLVIASQTDPTWEATSALDLPERLAIESGRPVLMIPNSWSPALIGDSIVIAWNGKREAARAVFDAIPLLKTARSVVILRLEQLRGRGDRTDLPDVEIAATLARHGVKVEVDSASASEHDVGREIVARTKSAGADLAVMGAYGHSRFREFVFGGATQHVARHMHVPTLFSH
ncbi:MAG: universal stress protein [Hyphomicrobiaceae bacterium]|nr:MAG: universal stress protein [Hyphomicrobiaceae bacterium]